jgi:predicted PurR-regulated permease PerM
LSRAAHILGIIAAGSMSTIKNNFIAEIMVPAIAARLSCFLFKAIIQKINQRILNPSKDNTKLVIANHCFGSS